MTGVWASGAPVSEARANQLSKITVQTYKAIDLSSLTAETLILFHATEACTVYSATLVYTEASSADAGITLEIGKESDRDFYYTGATEISKAQWYEKTLTLLQSVLSTGDTLTFYTPNNKTGTGEVVLVMQLSYNLV